jgi:hypothetical protein
MRALVGSAEMNVSHVNGLETIRIEPDSSAATPLASIITTVKPGRLLSRGGKSRRLCSIEAT